MAQAWAMNQREKRGSVTYSTDRENEVSKIFIISLRLIRRTKRKLVDFLNLVGRRVEYDPQN